jgi:hypothetical protein
VAHRTALLLAAAIVVFSSRAGAQDSKAGSVLAYDEAERLMAQGKFNDACPKYAESQRLEPQLGTLLHLADCLEQNGQTASAWASFREASEVAEKKGDTRRALAEKRIAALLPRLSKLQINVPPGSNFHIERDAIVVGTALWSAPVPTDPGAHTITASAPGRRSWTGTAVVKADGSTTVIEVPELEKEVPTSPETSVSPAAAAATTTAAPADAGQKSVLAERWPALVAGGVGVVGVVVGSVFGLKSMSSHDDAEKNCDGNTCTAAGVAARDDALAAGNVSTIAFIIGGVGLATGTVLWFTLPSGSDARAAAPESGRTRVGLSPRGIELEQTF